MNRFASIALNNLLACAFVHRASSPNLRVARNSFHRFATNVSIGCVDTIDTVKIYLLPVSSPNKLGLYV